MFEVIGHDEALVGLVLPGGNNCQCIGWEKGRTANKVIRIWEA